MGCAYIYRLRKILMRTIGAGETRFDQDGMQQFSINHGPRLGVDIERVTRNNAPITFTRHMIPSFP